MGHLTSLVTFSLETFLDILERFARVFAGTLASRRRSLGGFCESRVLWFTLNQRVSVLCCAAGRIGFAGRPEDSRRNERMPEDLVNPSIPGLNGS